MSVAASEQPNFKRRAMTIVRRYLLLMGAAIVIFAIAFQFIQPRLLFRSDPVLTRTPADRGWDYEDIRIAVEGETTHGWYVPLDDARGTVFFCHGNDGNMGTRLGAIAHFRELGFATLTFDYGGWGESTGRPSETRIQSDALAMWYWLTEQKEIDPLTVVIWGRSFGGGAAAWLAARTTPAAVVLESTFTNMPEAAFGDVGKTPLRWLLRHRFENLNYVKQLSAPVLIIHSRDDELYPVAHGRALYDAAPEPKSFVEIRGGHYDAMRISRRIFDEGVRKFFDSHVPSLQPR